MNTGSRTLFLLMVALTTASGTDSDSSSGTELNSAVEGLRLNTDHVPACPETTVTPVNQPTTTTRVSPTGSSQASRLVRPPPGFQPRPVLTPQPPRVIFLDVDGVLNPWDSEFNCWPQSHEMEVTVKYDQWRHGADGLDYSHNDQEALDWYERQAAPLRQLRRIKREVPDAKIVLSSSWRINLTPDEWQQVNRFFSEPYYPIDEIPDVVEQCHYRTNVIMDLLEGVGFTEDEILGATEYGVVPDPEWPGGLFFASEHGPNDDMNSQRAYLITRTVLGHNKTRLKTPIDFSKAGLATYVVLDDQFLPGAFARNAIWTNGLTGLTERDADLAISILRHGSMTTAQHGSPDYPNWGWGSGAAEAERIRREEVVQNEEHQA